MDFSASVAGVQVDLSTGTLVDGEGFEDQFSSIEIVTGSTFDDIVGGHGDDTLIGGDGSDVLVGGPDDGLLAQMLMSPCLRFGVLTSLA